MMVVLNVHFYFNYPIGNLKYKEIVKISSKPILYWKIV